MKRALRLMGWGLVAASMAATASAQRYAVGDIVQDFTLTDRATGQPVKLSDFAGKVVFLEWFAWWCPFCQAAASQIEPGVVSYYAGRGGNAAGVEIVHLALNLQGGQETETQQFITAYGLKRVLNDFDRGLANRFQAGGQPIFAIINGVANSPSHRQWELIYSQLGYGELQFPITAFRTVIDAVEAADEPVGGPMPVDLPPIITTPPISATVAPGGTVTFSVAATGMGTLSYQWSKDGVAISGATLSILSRSSLQAADAGSYAVAVTDTNGTSVSAPAVLVVAIPVAGRLVNLAVRSRAGSGDRTLIAGFTTSGGSDAGELRLRALGPRLNQFGVPGVLADPKLDVYRQSELVASNDNVANGSAVSFGLEPGARDAATELTLAAGGYTAQVVGADGGEGVALIEVNDAHPERDDANKPRLINLAARTQVGTGADILIAGFAISGNEPRRFLIRALGPKLTEFGVSGVLPDPQLKIFRGAQLVAANDDVAAAEASVAGLAAGSKDAAMVIVLPAGTYTAQVSGVGDTTGVALIEVNDLTR